MSFFYEVFPLLNSWLLLLALFFACFSAYLNYREKTTWALMALFCAAFFVRLFMAHLDPFLHEWDERYHALVARNMVHDPFKPMLMNNPVLPYNHQMWTYNHIWLHKQPLFLWQMALSMAFFGVSEFSIRYPSVLMGALGVLLLYRICFLFTRNKTTSFLAAILTCFSYYHLELVSGYIGMDQNDVAFDFYVLASIWAYMEYLDNKSYKWVILIGIFAGCAILNKWLTGLLVFSGWGINILLHIRNKESRAEVIHFIIALVICATVFVPWQLYIFHAFPVEARYEFNYNSKHLYEAVEGHTGDYGFYWHKFSIFFGDYLYWLLPVGLLFSFVNKRYRNKQNLALSFYLLLIFCFFSFVVKTKIHTYFMVVVPIGYIYIALLLSSLFFKKEVKWYLYFPVILGSAFLLFNLSAITKAHDPGSKDGYWQKRVYNTQVIKKIGKAVPANSVVILNCGMAENVDVMFYNNTLTAYTWCDDSTLFANYISKRNIPAYIFRPEKNDQLPAYIVNYGKTITINATLRR